MLCEHTKHTHTHTSVHMVTEDATLAMQINAVEFFIACVEL